MEEQKMDLILLNLINPIQNPKIQDWFREKKVEPKLIML